MMFDLLIFAGEIKKPPLGYFFSGVNKRLIKKLRWTHLLHKKLLKNPDFEAIYHFSVDSYHITLVPDVFLDFWGFFAKQRR